MRASLKVFVCSTYSDLTEEREAVMSAIRRLQHQHDSMEYFGARSDQPIQTCLEEVRSSDVLVVIVGHRYGTMVPEIGVSFTEAEYKEGYRLRKPCLVYIRDEEVPILPKYVERDPNKDLLLNKFKERLRQRHTVAAFRNSHDLSVAVAADISRVAHELETVALVTVEQHLRLLGQGVNVWNSWRINNPEASPDFSGANLTRFDLTAADLRQANLSNVDLSEAILLRANFCGANLGGANLTNALLGETIFGDTNLSEAKGLDTCSHSGPSTIDHRTMARSGRLSEIFLRGCGIPKSLIVQVPALNAAMKPIEFYSCFISHSSADQDFAERLQTDLQAKGVRVWFAPHDLPIGARIRPAIDESIRLHDKLLLVLSKNSVTSQWVEQEVEAAIAREREESRTVLFPIRIDDLVMEIRAGWPALLKSTRNIGDFTSWRKHDSYSRAFCRLLRDLKVEGASKLHRLTQDDLRERAVMSPRSIIKEEWDKVEEAVVKAAKRNGLIKGKGLVDCSQLINELHGAGKISGAVRERFFTLSKEHRIYTSDAFSSVEPGTAVGFASDARELVITLSVDTPPLP
jgi:uncharacterized protein YjbI with pentapeptide repeats